MSRLAKWKLEKTKVKVVFRLQFHATHIPQTGWDKLFISFIPADSGKATAKTTKANVRNGACKWADPIYETTRLLQDAKTKQYDEKLYKLVVAMGSSRSSILGEANINLADYADASKPSAIVLPLHGCDSETVLHVTVQLLTSKTGFREFEQQRELRERGLQRTTDQSINDESGGAKVSSSELFVNDQMVSARVRFRPEFRELPSLEEEVGLNEEYADSAVGCDGSSNTSESLYAEKHDTSSTHEIDSLKSTISGDLGGHSLSQSPQPEKGDPSDHRFLGQGNNDWVHGWGSDYSVDNDLAIAYEENSRLRGGLEVAESSIYELKQEIRSLQSHADEIGVETQKFTQQLAAEIASGEDLAKEVTVLKSECSKLKDDLEQLKFFKLRPLFSSRETIVTDQDQLFQNLQLRWIKGLLIMEDKIRELQNKTCLGFHETDLRFLHPDIEVLLGVVQDLKQGTGHAISILNTARSERENVKEIREINTLKSEQFVSGIGFDSDLYQPEGMLHCLNIPGLVSHEPDPIDAANAMKGEIFALLRELDESKAERESLARKTDQMECYYEALVQELEENQKQMLVELQNLRTEHSSCLFTVSSSQAEVETMRQEMNEQILRFAEERCNLDVLNEELERRAITSEAALKRARLNYSIAVDQLQKDLGLLSFQVLSMFETNENLVRQAFPEASRPPFQGYTEMVQSQNLESEASDAVKLLHYQNQNAGVKKQFLGRDMLLEDLKTSLRLQEELYQKVEEELCEMYLVNVHLDVFSKTLRETLLEAISDDRHMKDKMDELTKQLEFSTESKELLMRRLQAAMDDVRTLNEFKASCIAKCDDLAQQNQVLEAKLKSVTSENCLLTDKITEGEALMMECRSYESKYVACAAEKTDLANLLRKEAFENGSLREEISSLQEEIKGVKTECDALTSVKENLQKVVNFLQDKLGSLLATYDKHFIGFSLSSKPLSQDLDFNDFMGVVSQLEEFQHNACGKILELAEEKKDLEDERETAQVSLNSAKSEILILKQKFEHDVQNMVNKLNVSNALLQKLQLDLEVIANRLEVGTEAEEKYAQQNKELFSNLSHLEVELQQLTAKNRDIAQEILALGIVTEELGRSKSTMSEFIQKNQDLTTSLQEKTDESGKLTSELNSLKESLRCLHDELHVERGFRDKLEGTVTALTSQLNEKNDQLLHFDLQKAELVHFKRQISDLELEKSRLGHLLLQCEQCLEKVHEESSSITGLEAQLTEMHEFLIAADIKLIFTRTQYECQIEELVQKLQFSDRHLGEVHKKLLEVVTTLNRGLASEAHYIEENARLMTALESLRSELEASVARNSALLDSNRVITTELEAYKNRAAIVECSYLKDKNQYEGRIEELVQQLQFSDSHLGEVQKKHLDVETTLNRCLASEAHYIEENARLMTALESLRSELEASVARNSTLLDSNCAITAELEEYKNRAAIGDCSYLKDKNQYEGRIEELVQQLQFSDSHLGEVQKKHLDVESTLNRCLASEAHYIEENGRLMNALESLRSELEASVARNSALLDSNCAITAELEEYKNKAAIVEGSNLKEKNQHALEVQQLKHMLASSEEEIDNLTLSNEELEINVVVLKAKLDELYAQITLLEGYKDELMMLQNQCDELTHRLSEQILKTEEFKNLSIHFKELKDKADAECLQAREKRESEVPPVAMQDSLRVAFIKEQYETKLQELRHQLSISKKHGEEMLWKLQDVIDEVENRKKSEASHLKKNEELSLKILELEAELHAALYDKREKIKAYDRIQAELECSLISLECCKEEKQKLEASLQECSEEKTKIAVDLTLMKDRLESSRSTMNIQKESLDESHEVGSMSGGPVIGNAQEQYPVAGTPSHGRTTVHMVPWNGKYLDQDNSMNCEVEDACSMSIDEGEHSSALMNVQPMQDILVTRGVHGIPGHALVDQENSLHSDTKHSALINDHFKTESLKSSMDLLHNELERMKNENSLLLQDDYHFDPNYQGLQREMMQLHKANEELGSMFPLFNEFSGSGNALERVLALEIELAEALQAKKKSSIHFQSSFLKQHSDEEAVFKSFRDINELIKDMLEVKGRYAAVETELKEMHDRYSQLSLQFAEVEGERQKLMMTLKNVRASKKLLHLNRSSSAAVGDNSS